MKVLAITQARYGSTRLPAKILKEVGGMPLLEIHLRRILQSKLISELKVATTPEEGAVYITAIADKLGVGYHKGSVDDVLDRFYQTALPQKPDYVVRLTSDCPLIDPEIIDLVIKEEARLQSEHEHVTPYIKKNSSVMGGSLFSSFNVRAAIDRSELRMTIDEPRDFELIKTLIENVGIDKHCSDYIAYLDANPDVRDINSSIMRNEGYAKSLANDKLIK